ncbi:hypothetical protein [Paenibacillus peoriae]|uniref:hypothetical protein n=1 Tax=Paenibacillus peoriae TaxID=59893 RepID=UPI00215AE694|nr:hypothetical protein [Paenibacillus peoriae]
MSREEMDILFNKLTRKWDISNHYWYPLYDTKACPVIAFDSDAFEEHFGFNNLRIILNKLDDEVIEIRELKSKGYIVRLDTFEPSYEGVGEGYWFDFSMDWIIYCSHEGSITFGGDWIINKVKDMWKDWDRHLFM